MTACARSPAGVPTLCRVRVAAVHRVPCGGRVSPAVSGDVRGRRGRWRHSRRALDSVHETRQPRLQLAGAAGPGRWVPWPVLGRFVDPPRTAVRRHHRRREVSGDYSSVAALSVSADGSSLTDRAVLASRRRVGLRSGVELQRRRASNHRSCVTCDHDRLGRIAGRLPRAVAGAPPRAIPHDAGSIRHEVGHYYQTSWWKPATARAGI